MLYEELLQIQKMLEGNEYTDGGVSYYIELDRLDSSVPMSVALKWKLTQLKVAPPSMADAEIKYEVSHMTYSAISGATFELLYKMNQALVEQMKEFLEDRNRIDLTETKPNTSTVKESNPKPKKATKSTKTKKG